VYPSLSLVFTASDLADDAESLYARVVEVLHQIYDEGKVLTIHGLNVYFVRTAGEEEFRILEAISGHSIDFAERHELDIAIRHLT
jgi:predicted deacetylase